MSSIPSIHRTGFRFTRDTLAPKKYPEYFSCTIHGTALEAKILSAVTNLIDEKTQTERSRMVKEMTQETRKVDALKSEILYSVNGQTDKKIQAERVNIVEGITQELRQLEADIVSSIDAAVQDKMQAERTKMAGEI
ncbi:uncharacterized protein BCR38DRAFT_427278, partial [Pseudomassariella vexata]